VSPRAHRITLAAGVLVAVLAVALGSQAAVSSTIRAYFDDDGHLMFTFADGTQVGPTIPPGTYQIIYDNLGADDLGVNHAFHLSGPGLNFAPPATVVQSTFSVTFQAGATYTLQDDLNPPVGGRTFVATNGGAGAPTDVPAVTTSASSTPSTPKSTTKAVSNDIVGSAIKPFRGTLEGTVSPAGKLTLTFGGKRIFELRSGRYKVVVDDRTAKASFQLQRIKKAQPVVVTGATFVGKRSVTVLLDAGQWWFFSGGAKKSYFVVRN
jgi:hypothetical protein